MFHNSTTLHHSHGSGFTAKSGEQRVIYANWLATKQLQGAVIWDYMRPLRSFAKIYSWAFGWPIIRKGADLTMKGLGKAVDGAEWAGFTAYEGAKGIGQLTVAPMAMLAYSRLVAIKRFLWDVPIAAFSAAIRTPIALAQSPLEMVRGVRDAIVSVPKNAMDIFDSVRQLNVMDTLKNTRKAITDIILPPIVRPTQPVLAPAYNLVSTAVGAEAQTLSTARNAITEVIPNAFNTIKGAPAAASARMAQRQATRDAAKAILEKEKEEKREALKAAIAESRGEPANDNASGGKKKAA